MLKRVEWLAGAGMRGFYQERLSGRALMQCYALAPPRIQRYLDEEFRFILEHVRNKACVLELGCGYGRVLKQVAPFVGALVGNDTSRSSLILARTYLASCRNCEVVRMDAAETAFRSASFDVVFCIQNGISAFGADPEALVAEAARIAKPGGEILFSSYSSRIWAERVEWFRAQAQAGLMGSIDEERTRDGTIVTTDGFRATTVNGEAFTRLFEACGLRATIREIDESSVFAFATRWSMMEPSPYRPEDHFPGPKPKV